MDIQNLLRTITSENIDLGTLWVAKNTVLVEFENGTKQNSSK